ncbi:hypothetical protein MCEMIEM13_01530 [Comamonadaceae bacterium]
MADVGIRITARDDTKNVFGDVGRGLERMQSSATSLAGSLASIGAGLSVGALVAFVKSTNDGVDALNDIKDATGASIENISALEDVAARTGTSMDAVTSALVKLNGALKDAKPGSGAEQAIKALGLSVADLKKLDPAEALLETAKALNTFEDDANKARLVQELFGKSLKEVAPLLKNLADQGKLVATVTTQQSEEAEKFNKELLNLQKNVQDASRSLTGDFVTGINKAAQAFRESGLLEAMRTFLTGDDEYKNNKRLVELTDQLLSAENEVSRSRQVDSQFGDRSLRTDAAEKRLAGIKSELQQVQAYRKLIDEAYSAPVPKRASVGDLPDTAAAAASAAATKRAQQDANRELEEQARLLAELSGISGSFYKDWDRLTALYKAGKIDMEGLVTAQAALLGKQPAIKVAADETTKAWEEQSKAAAKAIADVTRDYDNYVKSLQSSAESVAQQVQRLQDEEKAALLAASGNMSLAEAIELVTVARLQEKQAAALTAGDQEAADAIKAEIQARTTLADLIRGKDVRESLDKSAADAAKQANEEWRRASQDIEKSITDALLRGFESGKGFAENLRATVVNMFQSLVLRPIVSAIVSPVAGALAGGSPAAALAGQGGAAGQIGAAAQLKNVWDTVTGSFANLGSSISNVSATLGKWMVENTSGVLQQAGSKLYAYSGTVGTIGAYAGGALAGYGIGSAISDGRSAFGDGNQDIATVGGTAIGAIFGGPVGAAIGGAIGGAINRAFGQGAKEINASGITGTFSGSMFSGQSYQEWSRAGGWFNSGSSGTDYRALDSSYSASLGKVYGALTSSTAELAASLGLPTQQILGYVKSIRVDSSQLTETGLQNLFNGIADELAGTVVTNPFIKEGERASEALSRLSTSLGTVNAAFNQLDKAAVAASLVGGDAASQLLDLMGGVEAFNATTLSYYQAYYTEQERNAKTAEQLAQIFADLGIAMPGTLEEFRALVDAQDITAESGREAYAALMGVNEAFATVANSAAKAAQELIKTMNFATYADYAVAMAAAGGTPVPRFANGGNFAGGVRLVGEDSAELELTGPSRILNNSQIGAAILDASGSTDAQLQALRQEQRAQAASITALTSRFVKLLEGWDVDGMPEVRTA